jgi:hypothetical protein
VTEVGDGPAEAPHGGKGRGNRQAAMGMQRVRMRPVLK